MRTPIDATLPLLTLRCAILITLFHDAAATLFLYVYCRYAPCSARVMLRF